MALRKSDNVLDVVVERDLELEEHSDERFDRTQFAVEALALLRPRRTTVAVCVGMHLRVESGRAWGRGPDERWAVLAIPPTASRRAITAAVATLARAPRPYTMAVLQTLGAAAEE